MKWKERKKLAKNLKSLPVRGAWIEIGTAANGCVSLKSLPVRGAWIEMSDGVVIVGGHPVAPRAGSVD